MGKGGMHSLGGFCGSVGVLDVRIVLMEIPLVK